MTSLITSFDFNTFESLWEKLSEEEMAIVVKNTDDLDPSHAILPVLVGIRSYHFSVRNNARKSLDTIKRKVHELLADPLDKEHYLKGMKESASVCTRIYSQIHPDLSFNDASFFFKTLLESRL